MKKSKKKISQIMDESVEQTFKGLNLTSLGEIFDVDCREIFTPQGIKFDDGKLQWDLLLNKSTIKAIVEVIRVLEYGIKKGYSKNNWIHVADEDIENTRYFNAAMRHITDFENRQDPESGLHHLAHNICCDLFQLSKELNND